MGFRTIATVRKVPIFVLFVIITIFAPISRWTACSGVFRRVVVEDSTCLLVASGMKFSRYHTPRARVNERSAVEPRGDVLYDRRR